MLFRSNAFSDSCAVYYALTMRLGMGVREREREVQGRGNLAEFGQIELEFEFMPRWPASCSTQCVNENFIFIFETFDDY